MKFNQNKKIFLDLIKKDINEAEIVSFDVFDTLLLRPYLNPTDLFIHMEKIYKKPFFAKMRQNAEKEVRKKLCEGCEDVNLNEIYEEIDEPFKALKEKEKDFEFMVLKANPEMKQVYDYAKRVGKKIIIISDMYLPTDFVQKILLKNGFDAHQEVYVSSDFRKTKSSGSLYEIVLSEQKVSPDKILHIGDNKHSDYKKAREFKIKSFLYSQVNQQFLEKNPKVKVFKKETLGDLGASILISIQAWYWLKVRCETTKSDYWDALGYGYAGPTAYVYSKFVEKVAEAKKIKNMFFVARDGYILQKVFEIFSHIKAHYVYAPRFLNLIYRLDYNKKNIKQSSAIVNYYAEKDADLMQKILQENLKTSDDYHLFIQKNLKMFIALSVKGFDNYKKYLSEKVSEDETIGLVDTITGEFSSQKLIQSSVKNDVSGIYWGVLKNGLEYSFNYDSFINDIAEDKGFTDNWNFVEFLITSPEYPITNISEHGEPIYESKPTEIEKLRVSLYPKISQKGVLFSKDIYELFKGNEVYISPDTLIKWINCFINHPSNEDFESMSHLKFAIDSAHKEYVPLFSTKISFLSFLKKPIKSLNIIKKSKWKNKKQKLVLCLFKPFSLKIKIPKNFEFILFPALEKRFFSLALNLTPKFYFHIHIGGKLKK